MASINKFHPGSYLKDYLEASEMTANELSLRTGISERIISALVNEKISMTSDVAYKLSLFTGTSYTLWMNLQNSYDLAIKEEMAQEMISEEIALAKSFKKYMVNIKVANGNESPIELVHIARQLTGVSNLKLLNQKDSFVCLKEQHSHKEPNYFLQNAWLSMSLNLARKKQNKAYDRNKLLASLDKIRSLSVDPYDDLNAKLKKIFDDCGVSFVLLPYLNKSEIYGATKWFSKENVMLAVSDRGKKEDLFWFTLFHEISHVLMEHKRVTLMQIEGQEDKEADEMARDILISKRDWEDYISKGKFNEYSIRNFAKKINISPAIVLGRLHKEKLVDYGVLDKILIRHYEII